MIQNVITKIITFLIPLENMYPEVNSIIEDLNNYKYDSLNEFINLYFSDSKYSPEFIQFITTLVKKNIIDESYLNKFNIDSSYTITDISNLNILFFENKPLNVTIEQLNKLTNDYYNESNLDIDSELETSISENNLDIDSELETSISENDSDIIMEFNSDDDEILTVEENNIETLRKIILESQLNYLNNANQFIEDLENESEDNIYHNLLNLNDIRYIQHCISNLSYDTLKRLLSYVELMEENKHNLINTFMEEAIKKSIHKYEKNI